MSRNRTFVTLFLALATTGVAFGATPASGTLTNTNSLAYTAGPFLVANPSAQATGTPVCQNQIPNHCDTFTLTVNVTPGTFDTHQVRVEVSWPNSAADFDVYVLQGTTGNVVVSDAATAADPEVAYFPAVNGVYRIRTAPYNPLGQSFSAKVTLVPIPPGPPVTAGIPPRYKNHAAPPGGGDTSGEPSVGVDPFRNCPASNTACAHLHPSVDRPLLNTGGIAFFTANFAELRVSFDDCSSPAADLWEDRTSPIQTITTLDPIGWADPDTGRIFQSQLTGQDSLTVFSDDDGETWINSQGGGIPSGVDHQSLGGGPYNENASPPPPPPAARVYPNAIYYCSQDIATAFCARSDNGGLTFGAGVPIYTLSECGGLHGHVKVAPDGTVYVPNPGCSVGPGQQGVVVSTDNGLSWEVRTVPGSTASKSDPAVGIASDGTVYFGYTDGDGSARIAVSKDRGLTWFNDTNVGAAFGIRNSVFPQVTAGDPERAAFAFLGTPQTGNLESASFTGVWYLYIATTYDGGDSWVTVDAVPSDPVQVGCVWLSGGSNPCRNLLDFNDITIDAEGRVLAAYADGCVVGSCGPGSPPAASRSRKGSIARQSGGRRMLAAFDPVEPSRPGAPRLKAATRVTGGVLLEWNEPDDGGSALTSFVIYRGVTGGSAIFLATIDTSKSSYFDATADPGTSYVYQVSATNDIGEGDLCGEIEVTAPPPNESPCDPPGLTIFTDGRNDQTGSPGNAAFDIEQLWIAEPFDSPGAPDMMFFTLKVADLIVVPPQARWTIFFSRQNGSEYFVNMSSDDVGNPAGVVFKYGHTSIDPTSGLRNLTTDGDADFGSFTADGTIVIGIANSKLTFNLTPPPATLTPPAAGTQLFNVNAITQQTIGILLATLDSTPSGGYILVGNQSCQPQGVPIARDDFAATDENTPVTIDVVANDSDAGKPPLTVVSVGRPGGGTATDNGDGTVTYTPDDNFNTFGRGPDTFTYTIQNATGGTATATVHVTVEAFCPLVPGGRLFDDLDPQRATYTASSTRTVGNWEVAVDVTAHSATHAWVSLDDQPGVPGSTYKDDRLILPPLDMTPTSVMTFWHNYDFARFPGTPVTTAAYRSGGVLEISADGQSWIDLGPFITQGGYNGVVTSASNAGPSPLNNRQAWVGSSDGEIGPGRLDAMKQVVVNVGAALPPDQLRGARIRFRLGGTFQILLGGVQGTGWGVDDIEVSDLLVLSTCNHPPIARDDSANTTQDSPVTISVLVNDTDPDGDPLTVTGVTTPANGSASTDGSTVGYAPNAGFIGTEMFGYTIEDGNGGTASAQITVNVTPQPNRPPEAVDDEATTLRDTQVTIDVLGNDTDPDDDPLSVHDVTQPSNGSVANNSGASVTYTPNAGFIGTDSFTYTAADGRSGFDTAIVSVTVNKPANRPPVATDDGATTPQDTPITIDVLANDTDPDGDPLSVSGVTTPDNGTVVNNSGNSITYSPNPGFSGTDSFSYTVSDGQGGFDTATVTVLVEDTTPGTGHKVTGGSWIPGGGNGKANFGFNAKQTQGTKAKGNLTYDSGKGGLSLKGDVETLEVSGIRGDFGGACTLQNSAACRFAVTVEDHGEPGTGSDRFHIRVFDSIGRLLHEADALLGGGNIQVH